MNTETKPAKKWKTWHKVVLGIVVAFFGLMIIAVNSDDPKKTEATEIKKKKEPELTVSSTKLYYDYDANEIDADKMYKDKIIQVNGIITDIVKALGNDAYITLNVGKDEIQTKMIMCMLADMNMASGMRKGDIVSVVGKCEGKFGFITLRNCDLQK